MGAALGMLIHCILIMAKLQKILQDTSMKFAQSDLPCLQEMANNSQSSLITNSLFHKWLSIIIQMELKVSFALNWI